MSRRSSAAGQSGPAQVFSALGDPTRLKLVVKLSDGEPRSIIRLTADFGVTRQAIAKHLAVLKHAGLVRSQRVGRERRFTYVPEPIEEVRSYLNTVSEQWDEALSSLKSFVERGEEG